MTTLDNFIDMLADKSPSELLNPKYANDMYDTVPTDAEYYEGLKMLPTKKVNSQTAKFTAFEQPKGTIYASEGSIEAHKENKLGSSTKIEKLIRFSSSVQFTHDEIQTIGQAQREGAGDAERRAAAENIVRNVQAIKMRNKMTQEKLVWEAYLGRMDVDQKIGMEVSEMQINTNTRQLAALTSTDTWDTAAASSTADPSKDIDDLGESYTGKGIALGEIWMNLKTFNYMKRSSTSTDTGLRDLFKHTTTQLVTMSHDEELIIGGVKIKIYNGSWIDRVGTEQMFIPDGYIIGLPKKTNMIGNFARSYEYLNVDAIKEGSLEIPNQYGTYFNVKTDRNPLIVEFFLSHCGIPLVENPQGICYKQVF